MMIVDILSHNSDKKFEPYQAMANVIIDLTRKNGGCLPHDLLAFGFTKQETIDLWHMAKAMADVELRLMEGQGLPNFTLEKRYA